ncbi:MAG TPA: type II toxin-antitoxin system prevent-host-death family antitoxin [Longimicrobiales bacterium]
MQKTYSLYDAKARLSEIIRQVREHGLSVTVSYHGQPVAEIRPIGGSDPHPVAERLRLLEQRGELVRAQRKPAFKAVAARPGALGRFLEERE